MFGRGPMSDQQWSQVLAEQRADSRATREPPASQARAIPAGVLSALDTLLSHSRSPAFARVAAPAAYMGQVRAFVRALLRNRRIAAAPSCPSRGRSAQLQPCARPSRPPAVTPRPAARACPGSPLRPCSTPPTSPALAARAPRLGRCSGWGGGG